jgi:hypothetical protein
MADASERDLDRAWSATELRDLSERDLTILAFRRALKNAAFFVPAAVVIGLVADGFGLPGKVIGWLAILGFAVFALEPLAGFATGAIALIGVAAGTHPAGNPRVGWRLAQLLVAVADTVLYAALAVWVYTSMRT